MKKALSLACLIAVAVAPVAAQQAQPSAADLAGIRQAALDYMEGALNADGDRVARGVHPELNKVTVATLPQTGRQGLAYNTATTLVAWARGAAQQLAQVDKSVEVTVFSVDHDLATARAVGALWYDYLQLAKINGQWRIVNVLWANRQQQAPATDDPATVRSQVEGAALDYVEGMLARSGDRLARALHPEFHKVMAMVNPGTGEGFLYKMGWSSQVEGAAAGMGAMPDSGAKPSVEIQDISHGMASVKATSARSVDYLQMARVNGEWKIINVLWAQTGAAGR